MDNTNKSMPAIDYLMDGMNASEYECAEDFITESYKVISNYMEDYHKYKIEFYKKKFLKEMENLDRET